MNIFFLPFFLLEINYVIIKYLSNRVMFLFELFSKKIAENPKVVPIHISRLKIII
jgi:hypothetical protein